MRCHSAAHALVRARRWHWLRFFSWRCALTTTAAHVARLALLRLARRGGRRWEAAASFCTNVLLPPALYGPALGERVVRGRKQWRGCGLERSGAVVGSWPQRCSSLPSRTRAGKSTPPPHMPLARDGTPGPGPDIRAGMPAARCCAGVTWGLVQLTTSREPLRLTSQVRYGARLGLGLAALKQQDAGDALGKDSFEKVLREKGGRCVHHGAAHLVAQAPTACRSPCSGSCGTQRFAYRWPLACHAGLRRRSRRRSSSSKCWSSGCASSSSSNKAFQHSRCRCRRRRHRSSSSSHDLDAAVALTASWATPSEKRAPTCVLLVLVPLLALAVLHQSAAALVHYTRVHIFFPLGLLTDRHRVLALTVLIRCLGMRICNTQG